MICMGSAVAGLLFVRFWRTGRDRLFLWFAAAFFLESVNRAVFAWEGARDEATAPYLVARLVFFLLILVGIIDKNLRSRRPPG
ncbi:hypothetical protein FW784_08945 [Lysobacter lacus]|uniref:Uncharacterized protein n=2 Tax=Cognatilysobacter lacus TaxID=1643323 RepID=A0A5D8Z3R2_9GAMM|nr:hypothetical protein FW784_08945 [Lysobacter lacus]